ncbi:hypothetical protein [Photobacterium alginatilyticum]|uniref:Lipoprotein n=1 Tax=Photobacterium alginatilyticum TaxID=1775171 RepID=A0ABW9YV35_9GAMM|nr:hypothetical protein [Photobacterium alginatilyticum]NBI56269.1 hypothetical protein [Photobacterium alginatilyticum]
MRILLIIIMAISMVACDSSDDNFVSVYIDDGAIQCESTGLSTEQTAKKLIDYGVEVFKSSCGYISNIAIAAQCGKGDANINIHLINADKVIEAQNIGYEPVSSLINAEGLGYEIIECEPSH